MVEALGAIDAVEHVPDVDTYISAGRSERGAAQALL